jgi:hypothetical protein
MPEDIYQTTTTTPWEPQGEGLEYGYGQARDIFDTQFGNPFPGYSPTSKAAIGAQKAVASGPNPFLGPAGAAVTDIASGDYGVGSGSMFGDVFQSAGIDYLGSNPYRESVLKNQLDDIANRVKSAYSTRGRYGSNNFTDTLTDSLGDVSSRFNLAAYDSDMNRKLQQLGIQLGAAQGATTVDQANVANRMAAAGMAPGMSEFRYSDIDRMAAAGAAEDEMANYEREYPWQLLRNYQSIFGSIPGSAGVRQESTPESSSWLSALGGAGAGAAIGGSIFGPVGAGIGAGLGGLGSWLFS